MCFFCLAKKEVCVSLSTQLAVEMLFVAGMSPNGFGSCLFFASIAKVLPNYSATI